MSEQGDLAGLLRTGDLGAARTAAAARVKAAPADTAARLNLVDLLIVLGEWEKADTHADLAGTHDPKRAVAIAATRQLIRAAAWRDDSFTKGRPPELVTDPDAAIEAALARLAGCEASGEDAALSGVCDGAPFDTLRDGDDRTAQVLEVLTSTGKYMWVPYAAIVALRPERPERLRDLVWRPAELEVAGGPTGIVYLPATYHAPDATDAQRLARETDWIEGADGSVIGVGARLLLVGDDLVGLDGFAELAVAQA